MKRLVALALTAVLALAGVALLAEDALAASGLRAQACTFIGYGYGDDFTAGYLANRFYITSASERTLLIGKTAMLKLSRSVAGVKWKSSKPKVASVTSSGKVRAKKPGLATITAYNPATGFSATCTVGAYHKVTQTQAHKNTAPVAVLMSAAAVGAVADDEDALEEEDTLETDNALDEPEANDALLAADDEPEAEVEEAPPLEQAARPAASASKTAAEIAMIEIRFMVSPSS
ncbi:MAG: Ig-like domain-containing protein [Eggerthellaceae bacterium]|nr:Ig-like domain-containing protein [Eggerthellaceae bacterium]